MELTEKRMIDFLKKRIRTSILSTGNDPKPDSIARAVNSELKRMISQNVISHQYSMSVVPSTPIFESNALPSDAVPGDLVDNDELFVISSDGEGNGVVYDLTHSQQSAETIKVIARIQPNDQFGV